MSDEMEEAAPVVEDAAVESGSPPTENPFGEELAALKGEREALIAERNELKDQLLRKAADFDNYRKRMMKEKDEARQFANSGLLEDLCQVLDDFERAIRSSEAAKDYDSFHSGIVMIENQFASMLERKYNLKRMETVGRPFQPEHHEAIAMDPAASADEMVVVEEYQKGYHLHDRVLRTAKVKVGPSKETEVKEGE